MLDMESLDCILWGKKQILKIFDKTLLVYFLLYLLKIFMH